MACPVCPVCRGTQRITLPLTAPTRGDHQLEHVVVQDRLSKEFPCPECRSDDYVPIERVYVEYDRMDYVHEYENEPGFMEHVRLRLGDQLAGHVVRTTDAVAYVKGPRDDLSGKTRVRATMGVVSQNVVKSIDKRIAERQTQLAEVAAALAIQKINVWGGGTARITKAEASYIIRQAVKQAADTFFSQGAIDR